MDDALAGISEARILGRFVPSELQADVIVAEIRALLPSCCQQARIGVRVPQGIPPHLDNLEWHQDDAGPAGEVRHMVVWATEQPTHIRCSDGTVLMSAPFDLVWFSNDRAFHRQPAGTDETRRWFVAVRCSHR